MNSDDSESEVAQGVVEEVTEELEEYFERNPPSAGLESDGSNNDRNKTSSSPKKDQVVVEEEEDFLLATLVDTSTAETTPKRSKLITGGKELTTLPDKKQTWSPTTRPIKKTENSQKALATTNTSSSAYSSTTTRKEERLSKADAYWKDRLEELEAYKAKHGHVKVPYSRRAGLGMWVRTQRVSQQRGSLREDRFKALDDLGFVWVPTYNKKKSNKAPTNFETQFENLKAYKHKWGDPIISQTRAHSEEDMETVRYFQRLKHFYQKGDIKTDKIEKLNSIGFHWGRVPKGFHSSPVAAEAIAIATATATATAEGSKRKAATTGNAGTASSPTAKRSKHSTTGNSSTSSSSPTDKRAKHSTPGTCSTNTTIYTSSTSPTSKRSNPSTTGSSSTNTSSTSPTAKRSNPSTTGSSSTNTTSTSPPSKSKSLEGKKEKKQTQKTTQKSNPLLAQQHAVPVPSPVMSKATANAAAAATAAMPMQFGFNAFHHLDSPPVAPAAPMHMVPEFGATQRQQQQKEQSQPQSQSQQQQQQQQSRQRQQKQQQEQFGLQGQVAAIRNDISQLEASHDKLVQTVQEQADSKKVVTPPTSSTAGATPATPTTMTTKAHKQLDERVQTQEKELKQQATIIRAQGRHIQQLVQQVGNMMKTQNQMQLQIQNQQQLLSSTQKQIRDLMDLQQKRSPYKPALGDNFTI